jgi:hypothetical protein
MITDFATQMGPVLWVAVGLLLVICGTVVASIDPELAEVYLGDRRLLVVTVRAGRAGDGGACGRAPPRNRGRIRSAPPVGKAPGRQRARGRRSPRSESVIVITHFAIRDRPFRPSARTGGSSAQGQSVALPSNRGRDRPLAAMRH